MGMLISVFRLRKGKVLAIFSLDKQGVSHVLNFSNCFYVLDHSQEQLSVNARCQKGVGMIFDDT